MISRIIFSLLFVSWTLNASAAEMSTFEINVEGGSFVVTQDIPKHFFGDYQPITPAMEAGGLRLDKSKNLTSYEWRIDKSRLRKFTWGAMTSDGKIETKRITPPNAEYKPYDRMRILIQYEDGALEMMQAYRTVSAKYGERVIIGRYIKTKK